MNCDTRILNVHWKHHDWVRHVSATESHANREVDMWGRPFASEQVTCHVTYVCRECGTTREGGECSCNKTHGDVCALRLAYLDAPPTGTFVARRAGT